MYEYPSPSEYRKQKDKNFFEACIIFSLFVIAFSLIALAIFTGKASEYTRAVLCNQLSTNYEAFEQCFIK